MLQQCLVSILNDNSSLHPDPNPHLRGIALYVLLACGSVSGLVGVAMDLDHLVPGLERKTHLAVLIAFGVANVLCWGAYALHHRFLHRSHYLAMLDQEQ